MSSFIPTDKEYADDNDDNECHGFFKSFNPMSSSGKYDMSFSRQKVIFAKYTDLEMVWLEAGQKVL